MQVDSCRAPWINACALTRVSGIWNATCWLGSAKWYQRSIHSLTLRIRRGKSGGSYQGTNHLSPDHIWGEPRSAFDVRLGSQRSEKDGALQWEPASMPWDRTGEQTQSLSRDGFTRHAIRENWKRPAAFYSWRIFECSANSRPLFSCSCKAKARNGFSIRTRSDESDVQAVQNEESHSLARTAVLDHCYP